MFCSCFNFFLIRYFCVDGELLRDLQNIHKFTTTSLTIFYHISYTPIITVQHMWCIAATVDLYCVLQITLVDAPIDTTCKTVQANFVRPGCYIALWFYFIHLLLRRTRFSILLRTDSFFASRLVQLLKIAAAQGLGNSCTGDQTA